MKRLLQFLKFVFVGFGNAIIDLGVFNGLYFIAPTHDVKRLVLYNTMAVGAAILNSYIWNTRWTFRLQRRTRGPGARRQRVLFLIQSLINIVVNDLILGLIAPLIADTHVVDHVIANNIAKLLAMFLASVTSFVMMKLVVFV
ncbi:MAG: GtrA family protein [Sulfobacillus acidophilus]|uniref:GtrA family protein n=1 Tax=Sulfobacillus acidophilus TaxID=53633 RepID=A0A2T2WI48_9FIRM|nr:MAG: GtrA family protein [Sulfobacillus acidophilus]